MNKNEIIEASINSLYRTLCIVWLAILISMFITIGIHYIVYDIFKESENFYSPYDNLKYIYFMLIFLAVILCLYIRKLHFPKQIAGLIEKLNKTSVKTFSYAEILEKYSTNVILSIVLTETIVTIGFIFSLLTRNIILFYISIIISVCLVIYCAPKKSEIKALINYK